MRILIADDERTSRIILRKFLTEFGHDVEEADDGLTALQRLRDNADELDMLVLDIMMPEMDGLTLLEIIRRRYPLLPVIMLTAKGERGFVKRALKLGASDFLDKPVKKDALRSAIREAVGNISQKTLADSMQTSMAVREVQSQLLDNLACARCDFTDFIQYWFRPYSDAGGDFFLCRNGGRFCQVVLADVAGHDVKSSYAVAELRGVLDGLGSRFEDPGELLKAINQVFVTRSGASETFVCALCMFVDFKSGEWRIANAGVPYPFVFRRDGRCHWLRISGNMLGVLDDPSFETAVLRFAPGDGVLAFSDGLEEILSHDVIAEQWGGGLGAGQVSVRDKLDQFVMKGALPTARLKDDILLLALEQPNGESVEREVAENLTMALEMPSGLDEVESMVNRLLELHDVYLGERGVDIDLGVVLRGVLESAVIDGGSGLRRAVVGISVAVDSVHETFTVSVTTDGTGFDLSTALARLPESVRPGMMKIAKALDGAGGGVIFVLGF